MKGKDFDWQTNEFMLYRRTAQTVGRYLTDQQYRKGLWLEAFLNRLAAGDINHPHIPCSITYAMEVERSKLLLYNARRIVHLVLTK